jgi:hypothetical protein
VAIAKTGSELISEIVGPAGSRVGDFSFWYICPEEFLAAELLELSAAALLEDWANAAAGAKPTHRHRTTAQFAIAQERAAIVALCKGKDRKLLIGIDKPYEKSSEPHGKGQTKEWNPAENLGMLWPAAEKKRRSFAVMPGFRPKNKPRPLRTGRSEFFYILDFIEWFRLSMHRNAGEGQHCQAPHGLAKKTRRLENAEQ